MEYNFLIEKNKEYKDLYKKYNEILNEKGRNLTKINNETIKSMDLEKLDYLQLKELIDLVSYNIDYKLKEKLNNVYLSKKPYTNTMVEKMDFLNKDKKVQLDVSLSRFKNKYITHGFWSNIRVDEESKNKIIDILLKEDCIRVDYQLYCMKCHDYMKLLNKEKLDEIKEYEKIRTKIRNYEKESSNKELTPEEEKQIDELYDTYYDIEECNNPLIYFCDRCDHDNEFENLEEILKYSKNAYYIK